MAKIKKIFLDTAPIIYFLDKNSVFKTNSDKIFEDVLIKGYNLFTSSVTCTEYLVHPYRTNDEESIKIFWNFVYEFKLSIRRIDNAVAVEAAKIRAEYRHIKTADALQLAAAICGGCDLFLTNDKQLKQFDKIKCVTVEEWS